ncbi:Peroxisome biogenesis 5 -like protein [Gossypium arboreum]|uniref:Peroxisome biogenesis 5-like protein n=1 Tax=Gossypium arboreum TaxID=29729 RepID=A0A0B0ML70_GOSAR|nr:Peroxisome biogenesis 5 -like protein [Gossypium arboreum]
MGVRDIQGELAHVETRWNSVFLLIVHRTSATFIFKTALKLKPNDYSIWNKLGATQANCVQSADAILAYQQVASS